MRLFVKTVFVLCLFLGLSACGSSSKSTKTRTSSTPQNIFLTATSFDNLSGWNNAEMMGSLQSFRSSCKRLMNMSPRKSLGKGKIQILSGDYQVACQAANDVSTGQEKSFFESYFRPFTVSTNSAQTGLFTGYYEPELFVSRTRQGPYQYPVYARPGDLTNGERYLPRADIEQGALEGQGLEIAWARDRTHLFSLHVQGSGVLMYRDGSTQRIGYDGNNGYSYSSIGRALLKRHALKRGQAGWKGIATWVQSHPDEADDLFAVNKRYIFFKRLPQGATGPVGALGVPLIPGYSMAVDRRFIPLGTALWLETTWPATSDPLKRLVMAQDTGTAIRGPIRGDFFWGRGPGALAYAGKMKSRGHYSLLLPLPAATRIKNMI